MVGRRSSQPLPASRVIFRSSKDQLLEYALHILVDSALTACDLQDDPQSADPTKGLSGFGLVAGDASRIDSRVNC
ncbi:unnamed protein product [Peniophora sp. CBMAI 1063]|nr:unnamed protein product [Peniophora sp. CBMAI 1063]